MTRTEYLLTCLIEECAEVQQAAAKIMRFGLDGGHLTFVRVPGDNKMLGVNNREQLRRELIDIYAVVDMLENDETVILAGDDFTSLYDAKHDKVEKFYSTEHKDHASDLRYQLRVIADRASAALKESA